MNRQERLLRRINNEETRVEKILRVTWVALMAVLATAVLVLSIVMTVQVIAGEEVAAIEVGMLWWLIGVLLVSIILWVVTA